MLQQSCSPGSLGTGPGPVFALPLSPRYTMGQGAATPEAKILWGCLCLAPKASVDAICAVTSDCRLLLSMGCAVKPHYLSFRGKLFAYPYVKR